MEGDLCPEGSCKMSAFASNFNFQSPNAFFSEWLFYSNVVKDMCRNLAAVLCVLGLDSHMYYLGLKRFDINVNRETMS